MTKEKLEARLKRLLAEKAKIEERKFPKVVYLKIVEDGAESFLDADESYESAEEGERVAVYNLSQVYTKRVAHKLE